MEFFAITESIKNLREEYEQLDVNYLKTKSRNDHLVNFLARTKDDCVSLEQKSKFMDESTRATSAQIDSIEATVRHYKDIRKYFEVQNVFLFLCAKKAKSVS